MKEGWKYVMVMCGEQFAMTTGVLRMLMLYVVSLAIILQVNVYKYKTQYLYNIPKLII